MIVINIWGEPGSGKSTVAAGLFFLMKINKYKVELVTEYAKELIWDKHLTMFNHQMTLFSEQHRRLARLKDHGIDFAITDSPLPLSAFYNNNDYLTQLEPLIFEAYHEFNNLNFLLKRVHSFEKIGRRHDEKQSLKLAKDLRSFIDQHELTYTELEANPKTPEVLLQEIQRMERERSTTFPFPLPDSSSHEST